MPFCAVNAPLRGAIQAPFDLDGFTLATDGRVIVRVAAVAGAQECQLMKEPVRAILAAIDGRRGEGIALETMDVPPLKGDVACPHCRGAKRCDCSQCFQENDEHGFCAQCDGDGVSIERAELVPVGPVQHASHLYLNKLKLLAEVRLFPLMGVPETGDMYPGIPFTFDGGAGLLMPCRH